MKSLALRELTRPLRHACLYALIKVFERSVQSVPLPVGQRIGASLGALIGHLLHRFCHPTAIAIEGRLSKLTLSGTAHDSRSLAIACWRDIGRRAFEWLKGHTALRIVSLSPEVAAWCKELSQDQAGHLAPRKRWICLSAHFGHWELMAAKLSCEGVQFISAAAQERNGPVGRWITSKRAQLGVKTMRPNRAQGALRSLIRHGGVRAFLIDQSTKGSYRLLPFLGQRAPTLSLPSDIIERCRAEGSTRVLWIYSVREENGQYSIRGCDLSATQDPVQRATQLLEELVRQSPEQWLWFNDRWRR